MILKHIYRKELLDVLQDGAKNKNGYEFSDELSLIQHLRADSELQLVWNKKNDRLPAVIIVNDSKKEFLAWAATYLNNFKPFTAFFRVLDIPSCSSFSQTMRNSFKLDQKCEDIFVGLIIGETLTYLDVGHTLDNVNLSTYSRTFSYVMSKAFYVGLDDQFDFLTQAWLRLRQLTATSNVSARYDLTRLPWTLLINILLKRNSNKVDLFTNDLGLIYSAAHDVMVHGSISENNLAALLQGNFIYKSNVLSFEGTREERVLSLQKILPVILDSKHNEQIKSFTAAYLVDRLAPGTFEHFNILRGLTRYLPSALIWYGFFSGLSKKSYLKNISSGLGHRLLRDITRTDSIFDRPFADISHDEFIMLSSSMKKSAIRSKVKGQLEVEILPNITTTITWPLETGEGIQKPLPPHDIQKLKNEFENSIIRVKDSYQKILDLFISSSAPSHASKTSRKERTKRPK